MREADGAVVASDSAVGMDVVVAPDGGIGDACSENSQSVARRGESDAAAIERWRGDVA